MRRDWQRLWVALGFVLLSLASCRRSGSTTGVEADAGVDGGEEVTLENFLGAPGVRITAASRRVSPGGSLHVDWWVKLADEPAELFIAAREPGGPQFTGTLPGVALARGPVHWLKADGTWSDAEVAYGAAASGGATIALPPAPSGMWALVGYLRETASGQGRELAGSADNVLAGNGLMFYVRLSRPHALTTELVTADLMLSPGLESQSVKIIATLTRAGDSQPHYLPANDTKPGYALVASVSEPTEVGLFSQTFASDSYNLNVRVISQAGVPLGNAHLMFDIEDQAPVITGTVVDAQGNLVTDVDPANSSIQIIDVNSGWATSASLSGDGTRWSYSATVTPGRYMIVGDVARADGLHDGWGRGAFRSSERVFDVSYLGTDTLFYLSSAPARPVPAALPLLHAAALAPRGPSTGQNDGLARDLHPIPSFYVGGVAILKATQSAADQLADAIARDLRAYQAGTKDVNITNHNTLRQLNTQLAKAMLAGTDEADALIRDTVRQAAAGDFVLAVVLNKNDVFQEVRMTLLEAQTAFPIRTTFAHHPIADGDGWVNSEGRELGYFYWDPFPGDPKGLLEYLRPYQDLPIRPRVTVSVDNSTPLIGHANPLVWETAEVREAREGPPAAGRVRMWGMNPDRTRWGSCTGLNGTYELDTDGKAKTPVVSSEVAGETEYYAAYVKRNGTIVTAKGLLMWQDPNSTLSVECSRQGASLPAGTSIRFGVKLKAGTTPAPASATVHLAAASGAFPSLPGTSGPVTEADVELVNGEIAGLEFLVGSTEDFSGITATYVGADGVTQIASMLVQVTGVVTVTGSVTPNPVGNGSPGDVGVDVRVDGVPMPGVQVSVLVASGGGTLGSSNGVVDGGLTDITGHYSTTFHAPDSESGLTRLRIGVAYAGAGYTREIAAAWGTDPPPTPQIQGTWTGTVTKTWESWCGGKVGTGSCTIHIAESEATIGVGQCADLNGTYAVSALDTIWSFGLGQTDNLKPFAPRVGYATLSTDNRTLEISMSPGGSDASCVSYSIKLTKS